MNVEDALYHACHDYPGGVAALAARMGDIKEPTLYGMANPNNEAHGWSLRRFRQVISFADKRPLHALCEENGGVFVPVGLAKENLPGTLQQLATLSADFGDVARTTADAIRDGKITPRELAAIDTQLFELITAAAGLGAQLRADAEKASPSMKVVK